MKNDSSLQSMNSWIEVNIPKCLQSLGVLKQDALKRGILNISHLSYIKYNIVEIDVPGKLYTNPPSDIKHFEAKHFKPAKLKKASTPVINSSERLQ